MPALPADYRVWGLGLGGFRVLGFLGLGFRAKQRVEGFWVFFWGVGGWGGGWKFGAFGPQGSGLAFDEAKLDLTLLQSGFLTSVFASYLEVA